MAPSKTFNIPGLGCGFAIIPNPELRQQVQAAADGIVGHVNVMGFTGTQAAYQLGQPWLDALLPYLTANRNFVTDYVQTHFPGVTLTQPEGTYLSWLDWRGVELPEGAYNFFLKNARVALNDGAAFGPAGAGFTRLNFGTPRATLLAALERMRVALAEITANPAH
jgi:cystathionine beta-lyase